MNKYSYTNPLVIATLVKDVVRPSCAASRENLILHLIDKGRIVMPVYQENANISQARNYIIDLAYQKKADVLFIDSDQVFEPEEFDKLEYIGKDIVSAVIHKRDYPHEPIIYNVDRGNIVRQITTVPNKPTTVDATGAGFLLISYEAIRVFQANCMRYGKPFNHITNTNGDEIGEDISFCIRAKSLGFDIWVEPSARVGHEGQMVAYREHYKETGFDLMGFLEKNKINIGRLVL